VLPRKVFARTRRTVGRRGLAVALLLAVALVAVAGGEEPMSAAYHLRADNQEWVENVLWRGTGNVQVAYQDVKIQCDELELQLGSGDVEARGHVILDQGPSRISAERLRYNLRTKVGTFDEASGSVAPGYYFSGTEITKLDETHYQLVDATFTSCEQEQRPPWQFRANRVVVEEEGYGRFWATSLWVKGAPVFYLPYLVWPIKQERSFGLLVPTMGYSQRRGLYLGDALFIPLGRSYDTTVGLDLYSEGYLGVGSEWRWAPRVASAGEILLYTIRDPEDGRWQWRVRGKHQQDDLLGFRLLAEVDDLSDINFFQEFERSYEQNTQRSLYSYAYLTRPWGPAAVNLRADYRRTFLTNASGESYDEIDLSQLPEVEVRVRPTRLGHTSLYWSMISSLNLFDVDRGSGLAATYARGDLYPQLSYTLPGPPWLTVTPRVGGRATYYTQHYGTVGSSTVFVDESLTRSAVGAGVDLVGPSVSRVFAHGLGSWERFKHLIEPRVQYTYLSDPNVEASEIPRFDEVDSLVVRNRVAMVLANRLYGRSRAGGSATELGSLELAQEYSFAEPLTTASGGLSSQSGPLSATLRVAPVSGTTFDAKASYDTLSDGLRSLSLSGTATVGGVFSALTWYSGYSPQTGERTSSQVRAAFQVRFPDFPLSLDAHVAYDLENGALQQDRVKLYYEGSCWGLEVEYRDLRIGAYPSRDYRVVIDFKGLGRLLEIQGGFGAPGG
jgi:LPS-assembly protein